MRWSVPGGGKGYQGMRVLDSRHFSGQNSESGRIGFGGGGSGLARQGCGVGTHGQHVTPTAAARDCPARAHGEVTNHRARAFYEKYGFRKLRRVADYYEDSADGLWLAKDL